MAPRGDKRPFKPPISIFQFKCLQPQTLSIRQKKDTELQPSPVLAKKLWNFLRVAYFMMKRGIISKRKLLVDMNMMMRKRGKYLGKAWGRSLVFQHSHNQSRSVPQPAGAVGFGLEYEFSFSPSPVFFQAGSASKRRHHIHFPCINKHDEDDIEECTASQMPMTMAPAMASIEYSPDSSCEFAPGEALVPQPSPLSVRISNYSSEDEIEGPDQQHVDIEAEDFIQSFYERLRAQCQVQLLEYQEVEYQEMLDRGAG